MDNDPSASVFSVFFRSVDDTNGAKEESPLLFQRASKHRFAFCAGELAQQA